MTKANNSRSGNRHMRWLYRIVSRPSALRFSLALSIPSRIFRPCSFRSSSVISLLIDLPSASRGPPSGRPQDLDRTLDLVPHEEERGIPSPYAYGTQLPMVSELVPTPNIMGASTNRRFIRRPRRPPHAVRLFRGPTCPSARNPHHRAVSVPRQPGVSEDRPR